MRQIVKRVKNGQEVKFICSKCGEIIYCVFIITGDTCEINWDKLPEKCSCGAKLTNRQPIIDPADNGDNGDNDDNADNLDIGNICGNVHRNICDNVSKDKQRIVYRNISENPDIYKRCMIDLENAVSIDYFDMRLSGLKRGNCKIPDNIDHLRMECIKRNICYIESCMERFSYEEDECDTNELKEMLNTLRQKYNDMSAKSEDNFGKRRRSSTTSA